MIGGDDPAAGPHAQPQGHQPDGHHERHRPPQGGKTAAGGRHEECGRGEDGQRQEHGPGKIPAVTGSHQHPVQDEDHTGHRLGERHHQQGGKQGVPHGRIVGEQRDEQRAGQRLVLAGVDVVGAVPEADDDLREWNEEKGKMEVVQHGAYTKFVTGVMTRTPSYLPGLPVGIESDTALRYGDAK